MTQELRNLALYLRFTGRYATETEAEAALRRIKRNQEASFAMESLLDRLEKAEKDAERYRWLRDGEWEMFKDHWLCKCNIYGEGPDELNAAIDAAMEASK